MSERPMTLKEFDLLSHRDFTNGAVLDEIAAVFKERDRQSDDLAALREMHERTKGLLEAARAEIGSLRQDLAIVTEQRDLAQAYGPENAHAKLVSDGIEFYETDPDGEPLEPARRLAWLHDPGDTSVGITPVSCFVAEGEHPDLAQLRDENNRLSLKTNDLAVKLTAAEREVARLRSWTPDERTAMEVENARLQSALDEIGAAVANEGPHTIEHLLATASLGKHTTLIGKARYEQLRKYERDAEVAATIAAGFAKQDDAAVDAAREGTDG